MIPTQNELRLLLPAAAALLLAFAPAALQARPGTDGQMGGISRGSVRISLSVAPRFLVRSAAASHGAPAQQAAPGRSFCISSNSGSGTFSVTASSISGQNPGSGESSPVRRTYRVEWRDSDGRPAAAQLLSGSTLSGLPQDRSACLSLSGDALQERPSESTIRPDFHERSEPLLLLIAPD